MKTCPEVTVAHPKNPVRNSLGFRVRSGNVRMTGIRSRLELISSMAQIRKIPLCKPINVNEMLGGYKM
jgi:hypothetical protein